MEDLLLIDPFISTLCVRDINECLIKETPFTSQYLGEWGILQYW